MSETFWATGELTRGELVLGTPSEVVTAMMLAVEPGGLPMHIPRDERRLALAVLVATELQGRLLQDGFESGAIALATISDADLTRLTDPKVLHSHAPADWLNPAVPLVVVVEDGTRQKLAGVVLVISVASDLALLAGLVCTGLVDAGRLDLTGLSSR
jgi:hypothetical protein